MRKINITKPSITQLEVDYVTDAIKHGWGAKCYDYIFKFQDSFAQYIGTKHALATSSCTGAIHLALMALGVKAGDEVIVPESTWIASVEPILYIGAKPVFVDVKADTWCIDPASIEKAITLKTKAIIAVHLYGNVCEMEEIMAIAKKNNLKVLEDAAEGLGSEYKGQKCGSIGDSGVFSFHGTKTMSTGEGGVLVTNDTEVLELASILNDHGQNSKDPDHKLFWMRNYGYKYKMSNLQAAMGCAQLERVDELVTNKREVFSWYQEELEDIPEIALNAEQSYVKNSYWMPTVVFYKAPNRDEIIDHLKKNGIDARPFFYPLSSLPMFQSLKENETSYRIGHKGINLPSHLNVSKDDVERICHLIKSILNV